MVGTFPSAWEETAIVTIQKKGATAYHYMAITESVNIDEGEYGGEGITNLAGGRIWKQSPHADGTITLELYPIDIDSAASTGFAQEWVGGTMDTAQPLASDIAWAKAGVFNTTERQRDRFIVAIMWTDDAAQTSAMSATTTADAVALRFYAKECRVISFNSDFTDGILKTTVTFKYPQMSKAGTAKSSAWESTNDGDGAQALPAVTYT